MATLRTEVKFKEEASSPMLIGIDKVCDAVKITLGAQGKYVTILPPFEGAFPHITKDGVTVAKSIFLPDHIECGGANLAQGSSDKTRQDAGDGTTSTCILLQALIHAGLEAIKGGKSPVQVKKEIEEGVVAAVKKIKELSRPIEVGIKEMMQVATVAANNDHEIGKIVFDAFNIAGKNGTVTVVETNMNRTYMEGAKGLKIESGWNSPYWITDMGRAVCEYDDCLVMLYDKKIQKIQELEAVLNIMHQTNSPLIIVAEDVDSEALANLIAWKRKGEMKIVCVRFHLPIDIKKAWMDDMSIYTGATFIDENAGIKIDHLSNPKSGVVLGKCKKVIVSKKSTVFVDGYGDPSKIAARIEEIRQNMESVSDTDMTLKRQAAMTGGACIVYVGGTTEVETKAKKDRVDDSVLATQSALEEGIVAGGGICLASLAYRNAATSEWSKILADVLTTPMKQMFINADINVLDVFNKSEDEKYPNGYNFLTDKVEDLFEAGIVDSAKVVRCSLENAASVAVQFLMSEAVVYPLTKIEYGSR